MLNILIDIQLAEVSQQCGALCGVFPPVSALKQNRSTVKTDRWNIRQVTPHTHTQTETLYTVPLLHSAAHFLLETRKHHLSNTILFRFCGGDMGSRVHK